MTESGNDRTDSRPSFDTTRAYKNLRNRVARLIYGEHGHGDGADDIDGEIMDRAIEAMDELRRASGIPAGFHVCTVVREVLDR